MEEDTPIPSFKKPVLIGKIGKLPKQISVKKRETKDEQNIISKASETNTDESTQTSEDAKTRKTEDSINATDQQAIEFPYTEPPWSGEPDDDSKYGLEILKQGSIIGNHNLSTKSFWIFGRLPQCDISMAHPTISRYHAILQYRKEDSDQDKKGYYLYDLGSTHGTFLNKHRLKAQKYVRVQVGHMIKLGCSSRSYILLGPDEDQEEESELTVTEMKQKRQEEIAKREALIKEAELKAEEERIAREKREEERGVDWGMGEDAEDESDLAENPYAQTNNEELYLDDPKKALRGFMEREGVDFEYDCTEQGLGQFLCKVVLPIDDDRGRSIVAEVLHKGKKKEAVVQCALEACRILDRYGVLRQATHESKKRKAKDWQENDFYDSDEDTFLDRTGTIERKRENRMKAKQPQAAETYQSLLEKEKSLCERIVGIQRKLDDNQPKAQKVSEDADSLDSFMAELKQPKLDKEKVIQLKTELMRLKQDHAQVIKLVNIARPADLPPLTPGYDAQANKTQNKAKFPMFGKRLKVKVQLPKEVKETTTKETEEDSSQENDNENVSQEEVMDVDVKQTQEEAPTKVVNKHKVVSEVRDEVKDVANIKTSETLENIKDEKLEEVVCSKSEDLESKRKKNQRRIQQREEKLQKEKMKGYAEDFHKEDYNMWVPPENQTGDGKTSLNEKFGY